VRNAAHEIGQEAMRHGFGTTLLKAIFAGWLIATIIWLMPFAEQARIWVIVIITYVVGTAQFPHIVAGAVDVFGLAWTGARSWGEVLGAFLLPTLIGNTIGGVTLVAALNHAQVVSGGGGDDA
jgi:formate/nitrite transporter FocA (FNT family)